MQLVAGAAFAIHHLIIVLFGGSAGDARLAQLLQERIAERSAVGVEIGGDPAAADFVLYLGTRGVAPELDSLCKAQGVQLPGGDAPFSESYALKKMTLEGRPALIAYGADARGTLYAVGALLRAATYETDSLQLPAQDISTAPAWRWRGSSANQGGTMREITGARAWTDEERHHYMLDLALSGANVLYAGGADREFVQQYGIMTEYGVRPNQMLADYPREWQSPTERGRYVCPSVPEARAALLEQWDAEFQKLPDIEVLRFFAGDPGGCRCELCAPWGKTFVLLCADIAERWLKYHPNTEVEIANQDVDNAGDKAIFDYLNAEPRTWLDGISYGPGGNAMSDYFRPELREDLFEYPGHGPVNRYLRETLHQLPPQQHIVHYSDITHWISAQYEVAHPDPYIARIYGRRTFHTRPQAFYDIFQRVMPFAEGDIIYSEGYHDEFHQFMWNRLLWNPNQTLNAVLMEYCTYYFGPEAAPEMAEAMLQLEKNLEAPLLENQTGVANYYKLVESAGKKIPSNLMRMDHRWRLHMQKAAMDAYFQYRLGLESGNVARINDELETAIQKDDLKSVLAMEVKAPGVECPDKLELIEIARQLGDETNDLFGVRENGYYRRDVPLTDLQWIADEIRRAAAAGPEEQRAIAEDIVRYNAPGEGSFYDDAGNEASQPHLVKGESYDATQFMDPKNKLSQNTIAYSLTDPKGIVFHYDGLDPQAQYKARIVVASPRLPRTMTEVPPNLRRAQHLLADDQYIAKDIEVPEFTAQQFEYDVPQSATGDGALDLTFERAEGALAIVVSDIWLLKQ